MSTRSLFYCSSTIILLLVMTRTNCCTFPAAVSIMLFSYIHINDLGANKYAIAITRNAPEDVSQVNPHSVRFFTEQRGKKYPKRCTEQGPADTH